jgi:alginate O-acetyltransferase complex protein AlgI
MAFTSLHFLIFFPLVVLLYWITPFRARWIFLLVVNYLFYLNMKPGFTIILAIVTLVTFLFSKLISATKTEKARKNGLMLGISSILLPLFFYKYFGVINNAMVDFLAEHGLNWPLPEMKLFLPVGISFYTFMAIGYLIDVYNEEIETVNPGYLALFISFFPLILSGPIERAGNLIPQFKEHKKLDFENITKGLKMMMWGYFMKLVVADRLGIYIDAVYDNIPQHNGNSLLLASFMYSFQMYADLGGYSLIAIGTAKTLGIDVIQNFKRPFFATTMAEFWRRWHISLISWLTDYIYTPLSFSFRKYKVWGIILALMITFFISGIWHGAALTFLVWGLIQGFLLSIEALISKNKSNLEKKHNLSNKWWFLLIGIIITFLLFSGSLIFSKAATLDDALLVYSKIFTDSFHLPYRDGYTMLYGFIALSILLIKEFHDEYFPGKIQLFNNHRIVFRWLSYYFVIFMILYMGVFGQEKFIYFQF